MEESLVLSIIASLALIYFSFGPGVRLFKKKSHHYIIPPSATNDPNWIPIDMAMYINHIFIKNSGNKIESNNVQSAIDSEFENIQFDINPINDWIIVHVLEANFQEFHKLISFCDAQIDEVAYGFCKHKSKEWKDYIVKVDDSDEQHLLGVFSVDTNFGIYLTKIADHEKGNMSKSVVCEIYYQTEIINIPVKEIEITLG